MLESARFRLLIHHDDDKREYAYENGAEEILAIAKEKNYTVASIKNDWKQIFRWKDKPELPAIETIARATEKFVAVIAEDNKSFYYADEDGFIGRSDQQQRSDQRHLSSFKFLRHCRSRVNLGEEKVSRKHQILNPY